MKQCPFCAQSIADEAIKCPYCTSSLVPPEEATDGSLAELADARRRGGAVYIVDRGLIRFAKFVVGALAIFLTVGIYFYGFDLERAADEIEAAQRRAEASAEEIEGLRSEILADKEVIRLDRSATERLRNETEGVLQEVAQQAASAEDHVSQALLALDQTRKVFSNIEGLEAEAQDIVASIDNPNLSRSETQNLIRQELLEHLDGVLQDPQIALLRTRLSPRSGSLVDIANQEQLNAIEVPEAIRMASGGVPVRVALLSDEVAPLADLNDRITTRRNFFSGETASGSGLDHGTQVATLLAAIAPNAEILSYEVLGPQGQGSVKTIHQGVAEALLANVRIILMPIGTPDPSLDLERIVREAAARNVLLIAPNTGVLPTYPAQWSQVLAVGISDGRENPPAAGPRVDLAAPGRAVLTLDREGRLGNVSGGSISVAIVAGVAALVLSVRPGLSAAEVREILITENPDLGGLVRPIGTLPVVNAARSVYMAQNR